MTSKKPSKKPEPADAWIVWCPDWGYEATTLSFRSREIMNPNWKRRVVKVRLVPVATRRKKKAVKP